jgi:hypothetical protein
MTCHRACKKNNTTGATCGAETAYTFGAFEFTPVFSGVRVARSLVFCVMFYRSLFAPLCVFLWPLCCLSFDLRLLITHLVSSNFSYHMQNLLVFSFQTPLRCRIYKYLDYVLHSLFTIHFCAVKMSDNLLNKETRYKLGDLNEYTSIWKFHI